MTFHWSSNSRECGSIVTKLIKSIIILHTFPPGAGLMIVAMFIKEHWLELNLSVDCLKIFLDELHRWGCEYSCNVTDWMCFHLYLHTNTFSPWQSILFFTLIPFLSSAGSPSFLFWCILFVTFIYFATLQSRFSDVFSRSLSVPLSIPPTVYPPSLHPAPLLAESFPRRGRKPRHVVTSRNSEKSSNWRRTSR